MINWEKRSPSTRLRFSKNFVIHKLHVLQHPNFETFPIETSWISILSISRTNNLPLIGLIHSRHRLSTIFLYSCNFDRYKFTEPLLIWLLSFQAARYLLTPIYWISRHKWQFKVTQWYLPKFSGANKWPTKDMFAEPENTYGKYEKYAYVIYWRGGYIDGKENTSTCFL